MNEEELAIWPDIFRPLMNYSYSYTGDNIIMNDLPGGSPRMTLNYGTSSVPINMEVVFKSWIEMQIWNDFYFNVICQGTRKFSIRLNLTGPEENFVCQIMPGSVTVTGNNPFRISMTLRAEQIFAPFDGQLYSMGVKGYSDITAIFERAAIFANYDLE